MKDYEQGLVAGAGIDIPIGTVGALNLEARYARGLTRITQDDEIRNTALSVMLGYSFGMPSAVGGAGGIGPMPGGR